MNTALTTEKSLGDLKALSVGTLQQALHDIKQARLGYVKSKWSVRGPLVFRDIYVDVDREINAPSHNGQQHDCVYTAVGHKGANPITTFFRPRGNTYGLGILDEEGDVCSQIRPFSLVDWIMPSTANDHDRLRNIELLNRVINNTLGMLS